MKIASLLPFLIATILTFISCDTVKESKEIAWSDLKSKLDQPNDEKYLDMGIYFLDGEVGGAINAKRKMFSNQSRQYHVTKKLFGPEGIKRVYSGDKLVTVVLNTYGTELIIKTTKEKEASNTKSTGSVFGFILDNTLIDLKKMKAYELKGGGELFFMMSKFKDTNTSKIVEKEIVENINKFNSILVEEYLGFNVPKMQDDIINRLVQKEIRLTKVLLNTLELSKGEYEYINPKYIDEITAVKVRAGDLLIDQESGEKEKYLKFTDQLERIRSEKLKM